MCIGLEWSKSRQELLTEGEELQEKHDKKVDEIVAWAKSVKLLGIEGRITACPGEFTSDVGNTLAALSGTFGLMYRPGEKGVLECSLRSKGDFDVSAMAKRFGGGGHKNAAGFYLDNESDLSEFLAGNAKGKDYGL